jgi:regulatory protein
VSAQQRGLSAEQALNVAFRYLSGRERTVAEVRAHLRARALDAGGVEEVIAMLVEQSYLDDRRFARLFVQDKRELEQWGDERIRLRLKARGIDRELAEQAISETSTPDQELDRAVALLRRRIPEPEPGRRGWQRALGLLLRRGYDYETAADATKRHLAAAAR